MFEICPAEQYLKKIKMLKNYLDILHKLAVA